MKIYDITPIGKPRMTRADTSGLPIDVGQKVGLFLVVGGC